MTTKQKIILKAHDHGEYGFFSGLLLVYLRLHLDHRGNVTNALTTLMCHYSPFLFGIINEALYSVI